MPSAAMLSKLNEQLGHEFYSSNLYLAMSAWCAVKGLRGSARFLEHHADEEMTHMRKFFAYIGDVGDQAIVPSLAQPAKEFASLKDVVTKAREHEKFITSKIHGLVDAALSEKDYATFNFLQWYVAEQLEEETLFQSLVDLIELAGTDGRGLYLVDKEIGKLAAREAAAEGRS
jgi:ferritin